MVSNGQLAINGAQKLLLPMGRTFLPAIDWGLF